MQIGIIGAGKVGCSVGKYLSESGKPVVGFYSRTESHTKEACEFTRTKLFKSIDDIVSASDTLFITTPDDTISEVWDCIAQYSIKDKIICHFSGSLSSVVFSGIEQKQGKCCSIHPMLAFSNRFSSYQQLNQAVFTIEGMKAGVIPIKSLLEELGNKVITMKTEEKSRYHCAASIVSNQMIALYQVGIDSLLRCGFSEEDARILVEPLVKNNINSLLAKGSVESLTGPVERNDTGTVKKHLEVLAGDDKEIYRLLALRLVDIAMKKHKDRDYKELEAILMKQS